MTSMVTVITRAVSARAMSTLLEMETTLVPVAFLALSTRRSVPEGPGRFVCTLTSTGSGSRQDSTSGHETISTASTVVGAVVGDAVGVGMVGARVGSGEGDVVGVLEVGASVGGIDGDEVGCGVGACVSAVVAGATVGECVGAAVDGALVDAVGRGVGVSEGIVVGAGVGDHVGISRSLRASDTFPWVAPEADESYTKTSTRGSEYCDRSFHAADSTD